MSEYRDGVREVQSEVMWTAPRIVIAALAFIIFAYGVGFLTTGGDIAIYSFWAPKRANAERRVFENSQSFVEGKQEYISRLRYQYQLAEPGAQKEAIRQLALSEASTVDNSKLSPDVQAFLHSIGGEQ